MRRDDLGGAKGLFWDIPPKAPRAAKRKREPPARTWEAPDYLPGLAEALAFNVPLLSERELVGEWAAGNSLVFDVEVYPNYFLAAFKSTKTGKVDYVERFGDELLETKKLRWILSNLLLYGFNSKSYDEPICTLAINGIDNAGLQHATDEIILRNEQAYNVLRRLKIKQPACNHVDLIEVAPLKASLKLYGGRLHCNKMQDLPFPPGTTLTREQAAIVRYYCINDLDATNLLRESLVEPLKLRDALSTEYRIDVRSKSDAQCAEAIFVSEITKITGSRPYPLEPTGFNVFYYKPPAFVKFQTDLLRGVLHTVSTCGFQEKVNGFIIPPALESLKITIGDNWYQLGAGGLHSCEKSVMHFADSEYLIKDVDATSFYPYLILNQGMFPPAIGELFLQLYRGIVERRIRAKKNGEKLVAENLKILINGVFGKLGSAYSIFFAVNLLIQVTLTGQLALLMLVEALELAGIAVVSVNTDGVTFKCLRSREDEATAICKAWEKQTGFDLEESLYAAVLSRDINNYIAVKSDLTTKLKGAFSNPWRASADNRERYSRLSKNPQTTICLEALEALLTKGTPIQTTISECRDITKFVSIRTVKGGAVKNGEYLGRAIRWYYAAGELGEIVYARNGNKVPRTEGAKPLMQLPIEFPGDVNFSWYVNEATELLYDIGYLTRNKTK